MQELLEGIYKALSADLGLKTFLGIAPKNTAFPFVVYNQVGTAQDLKDTSQATISIFTIRFDFWYFNQFLLSQDLDKTKDFFMKNNITLDISECSLNTELSGESLELDPDLFENGKEVWRGILDLNFTVSRI